MVFLHRWTIATRRKLSAVGDKARYVDDGEFEGYLKAQGSNDRTFWGNLIGEAYKFTMKGVYEFKKWEILYINSERYTVSDFRNFKWVSFDTTKLLLVKTEEDED